MGRIVTTFVLFGFLSACSSTNWEDAKSPEEVYSAIIKLVKDEDYFEAREAISSLKRRFPQSRFVKRADLRLADVEFAEDNFTEAAAVYGVFVDLHPKDEEADYALFRKALSFFNDSPSKIARDQGSCSDAVVAAKRLIQRYPASTHRKETQEIIFKSRYKLAQKEAYVAKFYEKKDKNLAAKRRWLYLLSEYADLEDSPNDDAKKLIKKAKEKVAAYAKIKAKEGS
ncbi:outer membrane protein assembly factor BamD [bacterium]|nr:outer membrane protein assembly factor BamD [bacterium]